MTDDLRTKIPARMKNPVPVVFLLFSSHILLYGQAPGNAEIVKLPELQKIIEAPSEQIKVVNFWATWCAPCIKEIPLFEELNAERNDVKVFLVSLDLDLDPNPAKVYRFMERRGIESTVLLLNEKDPNTWIDEIDPDWSGALPATLIVNGSTGERIFIERQLQDGDLEQLI